MTPRRHLVIFAKAPRMGAVKSRLAAGVGALPAYQFYVRQLERLLRDVSSDPRWQTWLAATPDAAVRSVPWRRMGLSPRARLLAQGAGDLGARMARPMRLLPPGPVVIVGSDIPALTRAHLADAFGMLGAHEFVFGPARDGGYWLVGARRTPALPDPFRAVRWSSEHALADTLANLRGHGVAMLEALEDIDDADAWARLRARAGR
ncbi:MAG: TIGR04282 family arsenosugar biosynthesis glycosyltransferase [Alphaproteobacteria bacterium]